MNNLSEILEICLQELDNGAEMETVLARYPNMAAELRPMLQAARIAKLVTIPTPAANVLARNQAKVLQRYDQVFDSKPVARNWLPFSQRMVVAFVLLVLFFFSGTGMVRASFSSLPGDGLYPVKRSWEKITLFFSMDELSRDKLETKYNDERLKELDQLFDSGRSAHVEFVGIVHLQQGEEWQVATISVIVSAQTDLPDQTIHNGNVVRVIGTTSGKGVVVAERIELITASTPGPTIIEPNSEVETEQPIATSQPENEDTGSRSETETPEFQEIQTTSPTATPKIDSFEGILISINKSVWKINAIFVDASNAEIKGIPVIGATVKAEGYFGADGIFIATKLEIINNDLNNTNSSSNDNNINGNTNSDDNGGGGGSNGNGGNDNGGHSNGN